MMRTLLESRLHRVTAMKTDLHREGSCTVGEKNHILEVKSAAAGLPRP
jgi:aspartate 1-decarboxylase